ncbi:hypothetical protein ACLOJK_010114 [Asimina triloba]
MYNASVTHRAALYSSSVTLPMKRRLPNRKSTVAAFTEPHQPNLSPLSEHMPPINKDRRSPLEFLISKKKAKPFFCCPLWGDLLQPVLNLELNMNFRNGVGLVFRSEVLENELVGRRGRIEGLGKIYFSCKRCHPKGIEMLDLNLFREDRGNNPEQIRESQRRRYASVEIVDEIIQLDLQWRQCSFKTLISAILTCVAWTGQFELSNLQRDFNRINKEVAHLKIAGKDATEMIKRTDENKQLTATKEQEVLDAKAALYSKLETVGNLVHDSVPISDDEANNKVVLDWGLPRSEGNLKNHVELVQLLGIADTIKGADVAGGRGFYLKGAGVLLNQALISFGLQFLGERGYTELQTPFFMRKDIMAKCAQLSQFDEELYKVTGDGDDKYLIATAEQPLCAYHLGEWIQPSQLPIRYAGYSTCFRKEAGSHGRDTLGIFRVHQFEKVEQFCITSPNGNDSWDMHEEMLKNSEDFYKELNIPYRVVSIVSGALNDAAAKKYDLEGWFPASKTYRELVSCSNCTDYQARRLEIRYGQKKA